MAISLTLQIALMLECFLLCIGGEWSQEDTQEKAVDWPLNKKEGPRTARILEALSPSKS